MENINSEFDHNQQHLYMLEFQVDEIELECDKLLQISCCPLRICVQFLDLPCFELEQQQCSSDYNSSHPHPVIKFHNYKFLFSKSSIDYANNSSSTPLRIDVYKLIKAVKCSPEKRGYICHVEIPFTGCQREELDTFFIKCVRSSKSFNVNDKYKLIDRTCSFSGFITVSLGLTCIEKTTEPRDGRKTDKNMICAPKCPALIPKDESTRSPLKSPYPAPRITLDNPKFETLTNAEKLNDPQFRDLIYQTYPNEPTCYCSVDGEPVYSTGNIPKGNICPSGCFCPDCFKLKRDDKCEKLVRPNCKTERPDSISKNSTKERENKRLQGGGVCVPCSNEDNICSNNKSINKCKELETIHKTNVEFINQCYENAKSILDECVQLVNSFEINVEHESNYSRKKFIKKNKGFAKFNFTDTN